MLSIIFKKNNFEIVKKLQDKNSLEIFTNRMDLIKTNNKFNRIILLDHLDWMDDDMIIKEIESLKILVLKIVYFVFVVFQIVNHFLV